ncbi:hypothetical protein GF354_04680 [Candidatus Peregrinibacteria bacterium]|nr:hypothetical protein [Candidatus Peregrinibacteria bacterium]
MSEKYDGIELGGGVIELASEDMEAILGFDENAVNVSCDEFRAKIAELFGKDAIENMEEDNLVLALIRMGVMDLDEKHGMPVFILKRGALNEFVRVILNHLSEEEFESFFPEEFGIDLSRKAVTDEDLRFFEQSERLRGLKHLNLSFCKLTENGVLKLSKMQCFSGLKSLNLSGNNIGLKGVQNLLSSPVLQNLEELFLSNCGLHNVYSEGGLNFQNLRDLRSLDLSDNDLGDCDIPTIFSLNTVGSIKTLNLRGNKISKSVVFLAKCPALQGVEQMNLSENDLDTDSVITFVRSGNLVALKSLDLSSNRILSRALSELGLHFKSQLEELKIADNQIDSMGCMIIASLPAFWDLKSLDLSFNPVRNEGLEYLSYAKFRDGLNSLCIKQSGISDLGFVAFCENGNFPSLENLNVSNRADLNKGNYMNRIGKNGFRALLDAEGFPKLESLDVSENLIDEKALEILELVALRYGLKYIGLRAGQPDIETYNKLKYLIEKGCSFDC